MAIIEVPDSGATAPNDITEKDGVTASVPVDLTEKAATTSDAPNTLTETADTGASIPNDITEKASNDATAPNNLTEKAAASASLPNDLTEIADTGAAIPVNLTEVSSSDALAPNNLTEKAVVTPDAPNDLTETVSSGAAAPSTITSVAACPFPRTLTPLVNMDFANNAYAQDQTSVAFDDLFTYSRNSSETFWNRRLDRNGKWKTFLDTDVVGDVTNLLTYSEHFDHADWTKTNANITTNAAINPFDGLMTAYKLIENTSNSNHSLLTNNVAFTSGNNYTFSFYAKAAERHEVYVIFETTSFPAGSNVYFNLAAGTYRGFGTAQPTVAISHIDNGWYKCSITGTADTTAPTVVEIRLVGDSGAVAYEGDGASGIYICRAQLSESAKPLPYVKSVSSATTKTFTESPLLEYDPITALPVGIATWQSSTNLFLNSEDLSLWSNSNSTVESNITLAPDLTTGMDKVVANSTGTMCPSIYQAITSVASEQYTVSFFVKASEVQFVQIWFSAGRVTADPRVNFDLINSEIGTQDANIDKATIKDVGNGISRITCTVTTTGTVLTALLGCMSSSTDTRAQQNAWTINDGFYAWGGQCNEGAVAAPYIMTEGSAATCAADTLTLSSAGNFNANEYTLSTVTTYFDGAATSNAFAISDSTSANEIKIYSTDASVSGAIALTNSVTQFDNSGSAITIGNESSQIVTFKNNSASFYLNKAIDGTDTNCLPIADHNTIHIGGNYSGTEHLNGNVKSVTIYEEAMTAQEVELL